MHTAENSRPSIKERVKPSLCSQQHKVRALWGFPADIKKQSRGKSWGPGAEPAQLKAGILRAQDSPQVPKSFWRQKKSFIYHLISKWEALGLGSNLSWIMPCFPDSSYLNSVSFPQRKWPWKELGKSQAIMWTFSSFVASSYIQWNFLFSFSNHH